MKFYFAPLLVALRLLRDFFFVVIVVVVVVVVVDIFVVVKYFLSSLFDLHNYVAYQGFEQKRLTCIVIMLYSSASQPFLNRGTLLTRLCSYLAAPQGSISSTLAPDFFARTE